MAGPGAQVWELPGSSSCTGVGPIDLQPAGWAGQGAGAGGGAASPSPHGCPGAPRAPSRSLGRVGTAGQGEPCLLITSGALAWHSLVLAAPLPWREVEIVPGLFGVRLGFRGARGGPPGVLPLPSREDPHEDEEEGPAWQGCSAAASVPTAWTEWIQAAKWGGTRRGAALWLGGSLPVTFLALVCSSEWSQKSLCVPVLLLPLSLP